ncbi:conserved Plasmodium protein, unknown function [Plasmodium malariae]|uniref:Uncharacterized protein n=1 Tax=Plasmodium malariae TaxID=5858 RepID=A0A1C3L0F2_PLAMA|nr:conserved Plasmodium protein, unknown function [Plasmodium malariae]
MDTFKVDEIIKKNEDFNKYYEYDTKESDQGKSMEEVHKETCNLNNMNNYFNKDIVKINDENCGNDNSRGISKHTEANSHRDRTHREDIIRGRDNQKKDVVAASRNEVNEVNGVNKVNEVNEKKEEESGGKEEYEEEEDDEEDYSSSMECISNDDNSYYSMYEGYKTNYIMESLFDKNSFVYFMVPFNKYNYTNYYTNWNKLSFRMYASLNSVTPKYLKKKRKRSSLTTSYNSIKNTINTNNRSSNKKINGNYCGNYIQSNDDYTSDYNFNNPLISILNNFLYFLILSEFLNYNELYKLMPLCKCSYDIFNNFFYINVHINPFKQNIKDIMLFLKENKEYQFKILKSVNYKMRSYEKLYDHKRELLNGRGVWVHNTNEVFEERKHSREEHWVLSNAQNGNSGNKNSGEINNYVNNDNKKKNNDNHSYNIDKLHASDKLTKGSYIAGKEENHDCYGMMERMVREGEQRNSYEKASLIPNKSVQNNVLFTNNIINIRNLFSLYEFTRIYLSKYNREKVHFCISDESFKYDFKRPSTFFNDVFPYGNKICSFEYKVKLKKHVQRRWNLKSNYVHENYFHHISDHSNNGGIVKLIENKHSNLYPSFTSFISLDKFGYVNLWKIDDLNSLVPNILLKSKLSLSNSKHIMATDSVNLTSDKFLLADSSSLYFFSLKDEGELPLTGVIALNTCKEKEETKIKNIVKTDKNKCCVGLSKAICYRVDLERGEIESNKKVMENLQKINCFDTNTNIVLSKKNILIDDRRVANYVSYVNYNLIDYENEKKYYNSDNSFKDFSLTGISLTCLNSNNSIFLFDLRYKYPSTCLYYENVITETYNLRESEKLKYLNMLKRNYNSRYYVNNKKYCGFHDNVILYPCVVSDHVDRSIKEEEEYYVKNKILSDESFIYSIIKEKKKREFYNIPSSYLNMWRWCDKRQFKTFFHYYEDLTSKRNITSTTNMANTCYQKLSFDSIYKFVDAPNHIFLTYENSNFIHSLLSPSYGLEIKSSLKEVPFFMHPTNL